MKFKKIGVIAINGPRTIFINPQSTRSLEDVICHETLHARFPDLSEEAVDDAAGIMGEIIIKFKVFLA